MTMMSSRPFVNRIRNAWSDAGQNPLTAHISMARFLQIWSVQ